MSKRHLSEPYQHALLPFTLAQSDAYAWRSVGAAIRGEADEEAHWARMSRLARQIEARISRLEGERGDTHENRSPC